MDDQVSLPTPAAASKISEGVENIPIISTSGDDRLVSDASFVPESQGNQKSVLEPILESPSVSTKITLEQEKLDGNSAVVQVLESGNKVVLLQENDDQVSPSFKETTTTHSPAAIAVSSITLSSEATPASALSVFINPLALEDVKQVVQSPLPAQGISASSLISDASKLAKDYPCLSPPVSLLVTNNLSSEKSPSPKILDKVPSEDKIVSGRATMPLKAWSISTSTGSLNKNNSKEDINSSSSPKMRTRTFSTELFVGKVNSMIMVNFPDQT